mgnify:FL=1
MSVFWAICRQHVVLAWRGGHATLAVAFLFIGVTLMPFGGGQELEHLQGLAPGLLRGGLIMALLTSLDRVFQADYEDGSLDQMLLMPLPLEFVVLAKLLGHYIALVLPLLLAVPLAGLLLNLAPAHLPMLLLAMLAGSPALVLLGGIGASLAVSVRRGGLLTVLLSLPFYVPVMIFGAGATKQALAGEIDEARLAILGLISLASLLAAPVAIAAALRNAVR